MRPFTLLWNVKPLNKIFHFHHIPAEINYIFQITTNLELFVFHRNMEIWRWYQFIHDNNHNRYKTKCILLLHIMISPTSIEKIALPYLLFLGYFFEQGHFGRPGKVTWGIFGRPSKEQLKQPRPQICPKCRPRWGRKEDGVPQPIPPNI